MKTVRFLAVSAFLVFAAVIVASYVAVRANAQTTTSEQHPFFGEYVEEPALSRLGLLARTYTLSPESLTAIENRFLEMERNSEQAELGMSAAWYKMWKAGFVTTDEARRWIQDVFAKLPDPVNPDPATAPPYDELFPNVMVRSIAKKADFVDGKWVPHDKPVNGGMAR